MPGVTKSVGLPGSSHRDCPEEPAGIEGDLVALSAALKVDSHSAIRMPTLNPATRTITDKKLLFARPRVLSAARVRENWFWAAPTIARYCPQAVQRVKSEAAVVRARRSCQQGF